MPSLMKFKEVVGDHKKVLSCGSKCYNAKRVECRCPCGGRNHGKGLAQALANTKAMLKEKHDDIIFNPEVSKGEFDNLVSVKDRKLKPIIKVKTEEVKKKPKNIISKELNKKYNKDRKKDKTLGKVVEEPKATTKKLTKQKTKSKKFGSTVLPTTKSRMTYQEIVSSETPEAHDSRLFNKEKLEKIGAPVEEAIVEEAAIEAPSETVS